MVKYLVLTAIVFLIAPVVGCGNENDSEENNLREVTTKAITATLGAQSYRVSSVDTHTLDGETWEATYESEFVAPDRYHESTSNDTYGSDERDWWELISIGDQGYIRGSDIPQWCQTPCEYEIPLRVPEGVPEGVTTTDGRTATAERTPLRLETLLEPLNRLVDLKQLPDEVIDGADCLHYHSKFDMDSHVDMLQKRAKEREDGDIEFADMRRWTMNYEVWIEKESYLIRQLKRETHYIASSREEKWATGISITRLYDFNEPISIELPQLETL
jgi:hypothetical protein